MMSRFHCYPLHASSVRTLVELPERTRPTIWMSWMKEWMEPTDSAYVIQVDKLFEEDITRSVMRHSRRVWVIVVIHYSGLNMTSVKL